MNTSPMTPEYREQCRNYARSIGWEEQYVMEASDDRLRGLMDRVDEACRRWGCD